MKERRKTGEDGRNGNERKGVFMREIEPPPPSLLPILVPSPPFPFLRLIEISDAN